MDKVPGKEVKGGASKDLQKIEQKTQKERQTFKFQYDNETHGMTYDTSHTALHANHNRTQQKEIIIIKHQGKDEAVNEDFPCVLLKPNETLHITFINNETKQQSNTDHSEDFNVHAKGADETIQECDEILELLREQHKDLLQQLKRRENLRNNADVEKFLRAEYDKSVESFSEVKKVREIMALCSSVCQIRKHGSAIGTGFLLFHTFILTNAHVMEGCKASDVTAVFGYEDLDNNGVKRVAIKDITCFFKGKDDQGNHLDFALLELDSVKELAGYPELLHHYTPDTQNNRSEICIVGHPEGGVKKMDPCFVIGSESRVECLSQNESCYHVISQHHFKEEWESYKEQITYDSCFFHGSSGSPVFDADCKLIGIHTGGYVYQENKTMSVMEYACAMPPILDHIKAKSQIKNLHKIWEILDGNRKRNVHTTAEQQSQTSEDKCRRLL